MDADVSTKERSALYPSYTINESIELVSVVNKIGGKLVALSRIADELKVSVSTNSFKAKISTCRQFGLLKIVSSSTMQLTDLAKKIVFPTSDHDKATAITQAFMSAPLYQKLCQRFENQALPSKERLSNILLQEYGITKAAKDVAAEEFLLSAEQVGILRNGVLLLEEESDCETTNETQVSKIPETESNEQQSNARNDQTRTSISNGFRFEIPTLSGAVAQFIIPHEATIKDLNFIETYIKTMMPVFIANLKEEKSEQ